MSGEKRIFLRVLCLFAAKKRIINYQPREVTKCTRRKMIIKKNFNLFPDGSGFSTCPSCPSPMNRDFQHGEALYMSEDQCR